MAFFAKKEIHAVGVCMDENVDLALKDANGRLQVALGIVASGITNTGSGNQELFPDTSRMLLASVAPVVWSIMRDIATENKGIISLTSHKGCGGAKAQDLDDSGADWQTRALAGQSLVNYAGQVRYEESPHTVGNSAVLARMSRHPDDHQHKGGELVLTAGFGATARELSTYKHPEMGGHGTAFLTSMDWVARAITEKRLSEDQVVGFLALTLKIANGISIRDLSPDSIKILDAGRMKGSEASQNKRIIQNSIGKVRNLFY